MTVIERIKSDKRVNFVSDERKGWNNEGFWVYLKQGFCWDDQGLHIIHENSPSECLKKFSRILPCKCQDCR